MQHGEWLVVNPGVPASEDLRESAAIRERGTLAAPMIDALPCRRGARLPIGRRTAGSQADVEQERTDFSQGAAATRLRGQGSLQESLRITIVPLVGEELRSFQPHEVRKIAFKATLTRDRLREIQEITRLRVPLQAALGSGHFRQHACAVAGVDGGETLRQESLLEFLQGLLRLVLA